jgi:DNA methylase
MTKAPEATILGYACCCTPFTDHKGNGKGSGMSHAQAIASGVASASKGQDWGGDQNYSARPTSGAWREYHLEGWTSPPSRPALVLDPFVGSGTTLLVAEALGRDSVGLDLSSDYARLSKWRASQRSEKVVSRTWRERQGVLL